MRRDKQEAIEQLIQRVAEGMTTVADAVFLCELLGLDAEKLVPKREKGPFQEKVAR